jgi:endonuclease III
LETESDLSKWLCSPGASGELLAIKGIGPKTLDYLKILVGLPTIAVDRHVRSLCQSLGFEFKEYSEFKSVLCIAAEILAIAPQVLDGIIWEYLSSRSQRRDS